MHLLRICCHIEGTTKAIYQKLFLQKLRESYFWHAHISKFTYFHFEYFKSYFKLKHRYIFIDKIKIAHEYTWACQQSIPLLLPQLDLYDKAVLQPFRKGVWRLGYRNNHMAFESNMQDTLLKYLFIPLLLWWIIDEIL